jgi:hypothetical protein
VLLIWIRLIFDSSFNSWMMMNSKCPTTYAHNNDE